MVKSSLNTKILLFGTATLLFFGGLTLLVHLAGLQSSPLGHAILVGGLFASLGCFLWFTHRYVTRNIGLITRMVIRLADGDDGTALVPVPSRDEIGVLAEKFNQLLVNNRQMTTRLAHLVDIKTGELQQANEALLLAGQVFEHVIESIVITDREGVILRANPAFETITGFSVEEALGRRVNLMKSDRHPPEFYAEMWRQRKSVGAWHGEIWNRRKNGEVFPAMLSITSLRNAEGDISHYIGTMDDISLSKRNEEKIRYLAFHDALTGLSNRVLFADRTLTGIQRAKRENRQLAMIVLDLDGFKQVNDTYGHAVGDLLLIEVGRRLQGVLRAEDTLARFGGDEFTALLPMIDEPLDALTVAQKILAAIETPVVLATHQVQVSASIGISIYPAHGEDYQALFAAADSAMYQVKVTGKAGFRIAAAMATPSMRLSNPTTDGPE